ncbi:hypothetical protein [Algoriphagus aquimarinus]|uniref:Uncharacterized protein n=1 Tax=Algoriphagus aquimarinus TaxID=237018 RepID=A0A1I1ACK0_9BACT|nr:hypothetical protein [Algoriphagus aquimarinus]SFB35735.1 hypothetical protein SAMN04489723_10818 [Algoriphagus aquimarinus]
MKREETDKLNRDERIDPDANPLISFGRDDDFTEELIKGICEKNDSELKTPKEKVLPSGHLKTAQSQEGKITTRNQRTSRKKRKGIT